MITGGQAAVRSLVAHGVTDLFGVPGIQLDPFYNALFDEGLPLDVYTARHEQGAAYMALGYAATSGRMAALTVVPGPGLLNASAALATAWAMGAPVLTIAGQISSTSIDRGAGLLHEIVDQPSTVAPFTRARLRPAAAAEVSADLGRAATLCRTADPRPVMVEIPPDILAGECAGEIAAEVTPTQPPVDEQALTQALEILRSARGPMIVVGGGVQGCSEDVTRLAEILGAPVVSHRRGRGVVDDRHPLAASYGVGRELWPDVDVVLAIGTRLLVQSSEWGLDDELTQVWINPDDQAPGRVDVAPSVHLRCRAEEALPRLIERLERSDHAPTDPVPALDDARSTVDAHVAPLQPQLAFLDSIRAALPDDGILVSDLTQIGYVSRLRYEVRRPRTYLYPSYMGTLGWALPTALGAKVAERGSPVVAVSGDGGFGFTLAELATAVQYGLGVVSVVFDNGGYGNVRLLQRDLYGGKVHATDLVSPDLVALAESFGARGVRADSPDEVSAAIEAHRDDSKPTVVHVRHEEWPNPWPILRNERVRGAR